MRRSRSAGRATGPIRGSSRRTATVGVEAVDEGKLARILVDEGTEGVAVNTPIAELAGNGADTAAAATLPDASPPQQAQALPGSTGQAPPPPATAPLAEPAPEKDW